MQPDEYAAQFEDIHEKFAALAAKIAPDEYIAVASRDELKRDMAQALELGQKKIDLYNQMLDDPDFVENCDRSYFTEFCKRFDEATNG